VVTCNVRRADDSLGAGAIVNAARGVRVLNRMTADEAKMPKIEPEDRRYYLRVCKDKVNLQPAGKATWVHLASVELPNGTGAEQGDNVQVAEGWDYYPQPFDDVTTDDTRLIRAQARKGNYRKDSRSPDWISLPIADRLGLDPEDDRKKINTILKSWIEDGVLAVGTRKDEKRRGREFVVAGSWKDAETEFPTGDVCSSGDD
jgi:hypothetical protein